MDDYKSILVHLDNGPHLATRLNLAADLAQRFDSRLAGLYAINSTETASAIGEAGIPVATSLRHTKEESCRHARVLFNTVVAEHGFHAADWWTCNAHASACVAAYARYVDLVVVEQPGASDSGVNTGFLNSVLLGAGRPVLVVPRYAPSLNASMKHIVLAWNGSRESARAVDDALPFLRGAKQVTVMIIQDRPRESAIAGDTDIGVYLTRHCIPARFKHLEFTGSITETINDYAAQSDADMVVMGAYGYSRLAEIILGSATQAMLGEMRVPVLMSH
ncbi:MAG TPA: universal stress protein [Burkholderiales bacterium]|nr:universal stress protein [Burkholderiales bacterium]